MQEFTWRGGGEDAEGRGTRCGNVENAPQQDNNYALESYGQKALLLLAFVPWSSWCFKRSALE